MLSDCYPGDYVAIEDDRGTAPYVVVQIGAHMGHVGKGKHRYPTWHLVTTVDHESFVPLYETWRAIGDVEVLDVVCTAVSMREMRFGRRDSHGEPGEYDPLTARKGGTF